MALTDKQRKILRDGLADGKVADEIADAIDNGGNPQADAVAALGATADLVGVDGAGDNAAPLVETESRLDGLEAKVDEVIAALKAAGIMAS